MGNRPAELAAALTSALDQVGVHTEIIVVANGVPAEQLEFAADDRIAVVDVATNAGIPGGRNLGADRATAPLLAFLDDDATFIDRDVLSRCVAVFDSRPHVGVLALGIVDENGTTARRHVPRVGSRGGGRAGRVSLFLGGACVVRASAFREVGGYAAEFIYAMEETDLALRLVDHGWELRYDGRPAVSHPATDPSRHPEAAARTMRNRVWLAHRNLPAPLAVLYVANWLAISGLRHPRQFMALARSAVAAWRTRPGPRQPIRWRTVLRLTRWGRPPVI